MASRRLSRTKRLLVLALSGGSFASTNLESEEEEEGARWWRKREGGRRSRAGLLVAARVYRKQAGRAMSSAVQNSGSRVPAAHALSTDVVLQAPRAAIIRANTRRNLR